MSSETSDHDEAIGQFCGVTGADEERAKGLLEACDWNVELAINMHVDTDDTRRSRPLGVNSTSAGPSTSNADTSVITIPDTLDDTDDESRPPSRRLAGSQRNSRATSGGHPFCDPDEVRPPIPPVRQVLVQNPTSYSADIPSRRQTATRSGPMSEIYDAFRDFQAETQWQEMAISQQQSQEGESSSGSDPPVASNSNKRPAGLQDLFRPPLELMYRGPFVTAREEGTTKNKWLLVNIQDGRVWPCQTLNRDVWSNQTVKDILKENFIFWQVYHDSFEGSRYVQFYGVTRYPYIAIIDPRTGEQVRSWPSLNSDNCLMIDHTSFCDSVIEFLSEHPSPNGNSDSSTMKKLCVKEEQQDEEETATTLYDQSEEAQLEAAIKASLRETMKSDSSKAYVDDSSRTDATESDAEQTQSVSMCNGSTFEEGSLDCDNELVKIDDYRDYLGTNTDRNADLMIRFPDGAKTTVKFPVDSPMKALFLFLASHGYKMDQYNFVTNFPRRLLHEVPSTQTMAETNLSRETIFVERKPE